MSKEFEWFLEGFLLNWLSGSSIRLRFLNSNDWNIVRRWVRDHELARLMTNDVSAFDLREGYYYGIELPEKKEQAARLIGYLGLHDWNQEEETAELTICIGEKGLWDKGFGADAIHTLLRYLFYQAQLESIYLRVFRDNHRAIHCYEKCGFQKVGVLKAGKRAARGWRDIILMESTRSKWVNDRLDSRHTAS